MSTRLLNNIWPTLLSLNLILILITQLLVSSFHVLIIHASHHRANYNTAQWRNLIFHMYLTCSLHVSTAHHSIKTMVRLWLSANARKKTDPWLSESSWIHTIIILSYFINCTLDLNASFVTPSWMNVHRHPVSHLVILARCLAICVHNGRLN